MKKNTAISLFLFLFIVQVVANETNTLENHWNPTKKINYFEKENINENYAAKTENKNIIQSTNLKGKVENPTLYSAKLTYYKNLVSFEEETFDLILDHNNEFNLILNLEEPTLAIFSYGRNKLELFLEPGKELELEFIGTAFFYSMKFKGVGADNNKFLKEFNEVFGQYTNNFLYHDLVNKSSGEFKHYMNQIRNKKLNYLNNYPTSSRVKFTTEFKNYIRAEIDYWWAFNLLRYRWEYPSANTYSFPMKFVSNYYDFLKRIDIKDDKARYNKNYLDFLFLFAKLEEDKLEEELLVQLKRDRFKITATKIKVFSTINGQEKDIVSTVYRGESLRYLGQRSSTMTSQTIDGIHKTEHWYKIRTYNGEEGWIFGGAGELLEAFNRQKSTANKVITKTIAIEEEITKKVYIAQVDRLRVRKSPNQPNAVTLVKKGAEMNFLGRQSDRTYTFTIGGKSLTDYFYNVEAGNGIVGWVFGGGVKLEERKTTQKVYRTQQMTTPTYNYTTSADDLYLTGRAKYYVTARKIYWRSNSTTYQFMEDEVSEFLKNNTYQELDVAIEDIYNSAIVRGNISSDVTESPYAKMLPAYENVLNEKSGTAKKNIPTAVATTVGRLEKNLESELDLLARGYTPDEAQRILAERRRKEKNTPENQFTVSTINPATILGQINLEPVERTKYAIQISGKINNHKGKKAQIILYPDPVNREEVNYVLHIKSDGSFSTVLNIFQSTVGKIVYGASSTEIYLEPHKNLAVSFDANDFEKTIGFSDLGGTHNNFIRKIRTRFRNQDIETKGKVYSYNPKNFKNYMDHVYTQKLDFLKKQKKDISPEFENYIKGDIDYWYAYYLTNYRWENPLQYGISEPIEIKEKKYYNYLDEISITNENVLPNEFYIYFLESFMRDKRLEQENEGLKLFEISDKYLKGNIKYFYIAKRLVEECKNGNLSRVMYDVKQFMNECPVIEYKETLKDILRETKVLLKDMPAPDFTLVDIDGKQITLSDLKGKIIFIDFWATWCKMCVHQIDNSTHLRKKFEGKDVVFLYISLDYNKNDWRNFVQRKKYTGVHVHAEGILNAQVALDYGVKELPAVFLINRDGTIAQSSSKMPDDPNIVEQITKLLKMNQ